ncbi:MAG: hypothetical protein ACE5GC_06220 [Acidimicrobiia bacterium]
MSRSPYVIAAAILAAAVAWTIHLANGPDPFAANSGLAIASGLVAFSVIDAAGLLLARGRWARYLGRTILIAQGALFIATATTAAGLVAVSISAAAAFGLEGPWLDGWIRTRPSAEGPGPRSLAVVFGALAFLPAVGVASPTGLEPWHVLLAGLGVILTWAYARAMVWSVWVIRLGLPVAAIPAVAAGPLAGAVLLGALTVFVTGSAWTRDAMRAANPLFDRLPGPRHHAPRQAQDRDVVDG